MLVVDTGILLRAINKLDPNYETIQEMFRTLRRKRALFYTFPQNVAEFWVVSTRPKSANGYELTIEDAAKRLALLERMGVVLPDHADAYKHWKRLIVEHRVQGKPTHDARIVAQMIAHDLTTIITLNPGDFVRYDFLTVVTPEEALSGKGL